MKRAFAIVAIALSATAAAQSIHYLEREWRNSSGDTMCQYSNGTVLNVGIRLCPLSIRS